MTVLSTAAALATLLLVASAHAFVVPSSPAPTTPRPSSATSKRSMTIDPAAAHTAADLIQTAAATTLHHLPTTSLADAVLETASTASMAVDAVSQSGIDAPDLADAASSIPESGGVGYSKASYYTTLGLYALSFPGIWSQIKRSTKAKIKRKTFVSDGEAAEDGKDLRQQAGEIMAYMKANNYEVLEAGETITFRGLVQKSVSQAFFLTFCTALAMASLALVLQIQFQNLTLPGIGAPNWFYLVLLSPYAGLYYWRSGDRVDDVKVKLASSDDDTENEVTIEGDDEELERMWRTLDLREKGMVKVEGLLESSA